MGLFSRKKGERTVNRETTPTRVLEQVVTLEGDGERQSDVFELTGAPAKLTFAVKGADKVTDIPAAYVLPEGEAQRVHGGPAVSQFLGNDCGPHRKGRDVRPLVRSPGRYYVHVTARDGVSWSVTIEEERAARGLDQVMALDGNGEQQSALFELTGAPAKLTFAVKGAGEVTDIPAAYVLREDEALGVTGGKPAAACFGDRLSDNRDLSRSPGRYYVHVVAGDATSWSVVIEQER